ncbi:hypothetical protein [Spirosoma areae]
MRTLLMKKAAGYAATVSLIACPFVTTVTVAMPSQRAFTTTPSPGTEAVKRVTNPVLARNTTAKSDRTLAGPLPKEPKQHDKKTIDRCWKRLITMMREVSHSHRTTTK